DRLLTTERLSHQTVRALVSPLNRSALTGRGTHSAPGPSRVTPWLSDTLALGSDAELSRREVLHDLLGAAADHHHLGLAVQPLAPGAAHEAHAAEDLHRLIGAEQHRL